MEGGLNLRKYIYVGGRLKPPEVEVPPGPYLPPVIASKKSSGLRSAKHGVKRIVIHTAEPRLDSSTASVDSLRQLSTTPQPRQCCQVDSLDSSRQLSTALDSDSTLRRCQDCQAVKLDSSTVSTVSTVHECPIKRVPRAAP